MLERDTNKSETAVQVGQTLIEFVENIEFGTPEYDAVSDYLYHKQLEQNLEQQQKNAFTKENDREEKKHWETQVRISEQKIAFLEFRIYENQSRIIGYDNTYTHIEIGFEHTLGSAANREAEGLFTNEEQQRSYENKLYNRFIDKAQDTVNRKRGGI